MKGTISVIKYNKSIKNSGCNNLATVTTLTITTARMIITTIKSRYNWVREVINWELCKWLIFDYARQMIYAQARIVFENKTQNSWDFEIKVDDPIPPRRQEIVVIIKKKCMFQLCYPANDWVKIKENQKLYLAAKIRKWVVEDEGDSDTNHSWSSWNNPE